MKVGERIEFPLIFIDEDEDRQELPDVPAVETTVEFVDDWDPAYKCFDATGRRVRLIVWALELLSCAIVPDDFDKSRITIDERSADDGSIVLSERIDGLLLRRLIVAGAQTNPEPHPWSAELLDEEPAAVRPSELAAIDFHHRWMRARLGRRYN